MIDAVPLVTEYNKSKLLGWSKEKVPKPIWIQNALKVQYCCALRISEVLSLEQKDFNFDSRILTLNHTKTGFENCKCSKWKKRKLLKVDNNCDKCKGLGKFRVPQFTSIPPDFPKWLVSRIKNSYNNQNYPLFPHNRQLMWSYLKKACELAKLELGEQQKHRYVSGAWTHLIRKSRSKMMKYLGASRELRMCKLRHAFKDSQDAYDVEDINALIKWEAENIET